MLDLGLPARRRAHHADAARAAADHAVLGHDARPDHRAVAGVPEPAHAHPRRGGRRRARSTSAPRQLVYRAHAMDKVELLTRVLQAEDRGLTMIFARTKRTVQRVADDLAERGFAAAAVHGDLGQGAREQALRAFRSGKVDVLVATDVAARGIDVTDVTHVINYQCPEDEKTYVHRIGRTGRAGKDGRRGHARRLGRHAPLEDGQRRRSASTSPSPPETYSTSEHLYTDLAIPTSATGRLPARQAHPRGPRGRVRRQRGRRRQRPQAAQPHPHPRRARRARHAGARPQAAQPHPGRRRSNAEDVAAAPAEAAPTAGPESVADADGKPRAAPSSRWRRSPWPGPAGRRHRHPGRRRELGHVAADHDRALRARRPPAALSGDSSTPGTRVALRLAGEPSGSRSPSPVIHGTRPSAERPTRRTRTAPPSPPSDGGAVTSSWRWRSSCCWASRPSWCGRTSPEVATVARPDAAPLAAPSPAGDVPAGFAEAWRARERRHAARRSWPGPPWSPATAASSRATTPHRAPWPGATGATSRCARSPRVSPAPTTATATPSPSTKAAPAGAASSPRSTRAAAGAPTPATPTCTPASSSSPTARYVTATGPTTWRCGAPTSCAPSSTATCPPPCSPASSPVRSATYGSTAMSSDRIGVIERCPDAPTDRLTVLTPDGAKGADTPEVQFSVELPADRRGARGALERPGGGRAARPTAADRARQGRAAAQPGAPRRARRCAGARRPQARPPP